MWIDKLKNNDRQGGGVRAVASEYERMTRLCALFEKAIMASAPGVPRMTGLGGYLNYLRDVNKDPSCPKNIHKLNEALCSLQQTDSEYGSLGDYRNYLSHGGIEPTDRDTENIFKELLDANWLLFKEFVDEEHIELTPEGIQYNGAITSELVCIDENEIIWYFQEGTNTKALFYSSSGGVKKVDRCNDSLGPGSVFRAMKPPAEDGETKALKDYLNRIKIDLDAFKEKNSIIQQIEVSSEKFGLEWERAVSDGSERRLDIFCLSRTGERLWGNNGIRYGYKEFLKSLVNWDVSISRMRSRIRDLQALKRAEDWEDFEKGSELEIPPRVTPNFQMLDRTKINSNEFVDQIDESSTLIPVNTQIYFVSGEAGVGKTYNLLQLTSRRFSELENEPSNPQKGDRPAFLYVSCSGSGYRGLEAIINNEIINTRNLNFDTALSLVRAGLLVIIVDGFDELITDSSYNDALSVLMPVLQKIGGHGTIIVSARSAYQANQYQESLNKNDGLTINIDHNFVEINRWTVEDVKCIAQANPAWSRFENLSTGDLSLLGIPYFAKSFHLYALMSMNSGVAETSYTDLRGLLIDEYLKRERRKIDTDIRLQRPVKTTDLRAVFTEVAGLMIEQSSKSIGYDDFQLACATALSLNDFKGKNRDLISRLSVLCGIKVSIDGGVDDEKNFAFTHDVFYEYFVGKNLVEIMKSGNTSIICDILSKEIYGEGSIRIISEAITDVEEVLLTVFEFRKENQTLRENVAAVFEAAINTGQSIYSCSFDGYEFTKLNLDKYSGKDLWFSRCSFQKLEIDGRASHPSITICNSTIRDFEVHGLRAEFLSLNRTTIGQLTFLDGPYKGIYNSTIQILETLEANGVQGLTSEIEELKSRVESESSSFAHDILERLSVRRDSTYVVQADSKVPGEGASGWMPRRNDSLWADLTDALLNFGLAEKKTIDSSGPSKWRVTFRVQPALVNNESSDRDDIKKFWRSLNRT